MIVRADVLVMTVLHPEAAGYRTELLKAQALIKMAGMRIALYYGVKLQDFIAELCALLHAVKNELFADMKAADLGIYSIACIADVAASSYVVRVEDVKTDDLSVIVSNSCIAL